MLNLPVHICVFAVFFLMSYGFYDPPRLRQGFVYFGYGGDPLSYIWFLNWWPFALSHHLPLFHTDFVDAPVGASLAWKAGLPALGLLAAPFTARYGAIAVANALFIAAPAVTGWGGYLAAFELTASVAPAFIAGLVFGFSSYMLGQMQGHLNLVFLPAVPLCLWVAVAAVKRSWSTWQIALPLGCLLAFQFGVSSEIFATFCMFGAVAYVALYTLHPALRAALGRLIPGFAFGLGLCLLLILPALWSMVVSFKTGVATVTPAIFVSNDLLQFFLPTPIDWLGGQLAAPLSMKYPGDISEEGAYIGLPLLALVSWVAFRRGHLPVYQTLVFLIVLTGIFSLGPRLHIGGHVVSRAPWILLGKLPFLGAMLPARFTFYTFGLIAILLALWLASPGRKYPRYFAIAGCLIFLIPSQRVDRNWSTLPVPKLLTDGTIPPSSDILILPAFGSEMGYQYAAAMRFHLVGQGYLGTGAPMPFVSWPLFPNLFNEEFQKIDPKQMASYLSTYRVQYVVVSNQLYRDYQRGINLDTGVTRAAAVKLLEAAGWSVTKSTPDATLLQP